VECEQHHTVLPVTDVRAAIDFYTTKLAFWLAFSIGEPPHFAGVNLGRGAQIFLSAGTPNPNGVWMYFVIDDADALYDFHRAGGVEIIAPPGDREYGFRDYRIRDLYGYEIEFGHRLER
ncbi:MAG TPA: VOC family protein, partial [Thermoanaerobaculia bacterium]|nr:VOC family protein [Thermoanaerobaculia bacterium]